MPALLCLPFAFVASASRLGLALLATWAGLWGLLAAPLAQAHEARVGDLVVEHPYALPSVPGSPNGAAYLRAVRNTGTQPDRLLGASTPVARTVEIHHMAQDTAGVMRMRQVEGLDLPAGASVALKHGGEWHLMLMNLQRPLKVGERFALTLRFERAGAQEVTVWVQSPKDAKAAEHAHH